jgi:hypothetical protein
MLRQAWIPWALARLLSEHEQLILDAAHQEQISNRTCRRGWAGQRRPKPEQGCGYQLLVHSSCLVVYQEEGRACDACWSI